MVALAKLEKLEIGQKTGSELPVPINREKVRIAG
jgi:hypothetical protein